MKYLDVRAVLNIHEQLVDDFARSQDPIDPPGVRGDGELLESALTRPRTSLGTRLKYPTIEMAAAALLHALVHDHPFHNGNKRTAIVALLVFLDQNGYVLHAEENELFDYVLDLASHRAHSSTGAPALESDLETIHAAEWIAEHARKLNKVQRALKWRELEPILRGFDCAIELRTGNSVVIRRGNLTAFSGRRNIGEEIDLEGVSHIRKALHLDEEHGIDSSCFYYNAAVVPAFINKYRQLLRRLASY
jgi:death-on-curing family protein